MSVEVISTKGCTAILGVFRWVLIKELFDGLLLNINCNTL